MSATAKRKNKKKHVDPEFGRKLAEAIKRKNKKLDEETKTE